MIFIQPSFQKFKGIDDAKEYLTKSTNESQEFSVIFIILR